MPFSPLPFILGGLFPFPHQDYAEQCLKWTQALLLHAQLC